MEQLIKVLDPTRFPFLFFKRSPFASIDQSALSNACKRDSKHVYLSIRLWSLIPLVIKVY